MSSFLRWRFWSFAGRLVALVALVGSPSTVRGQTLSEVWAHCDENRRAYANMEAVYREEAECLLPPSDPPSDHTVKREIREHHGIWQGRRYRYDLQHRWEAQSGRVLQFDSLFAYDGKSSRAASLCSVGSSGGNISDRRITLAHGRPPQLLAMSSFGELSPSDIARRTPEMEQDEPLLRGAEYVTSELAGDEVVAGLPCLVVDCYLHFREHRTRHRHWIAPDRSYLPIASAVFWSCDDTIPCSKTETGDWKEIAAGVWAPFSARTESRQVRDDFSVAAEPWMIQTTTVTSIQLNPEHPDKIFSEVPMPVGAQIYILEGGKVVGYDYIEDPNAKETPEELGLIRKRIAP